MEERRAPEPYGSYSGLDDFEEEMAQDSQDFASLLRSRVASEQKQNQDIRGFEKTKDNVTIVEISGQDLTVAWSQSEEVHWVFEVTVTSPRTLHSVVLFDTLATDFSIESLWLVTYGGHKKEVVGDDAVQGVGQQLHQKVVPPDKVQVKVSLKPHLGILGQLILFDFGSFHMVRGLCVHVLSEQESRLMQGNTPHAHKIEKPDLYWEQRYHQINMGSYSEKADRSLPDYPLPEQIEQLIEAGKYNNVENKVTKDNYKRRMHNLLYLEEYQQRVDMSRYDLYNIEISPHKDFRTPMGVHYATEGFYYIKVAVDEVLYEGGRSVRYGDGALLLPQNQQVIHECTVEHVSRDSVILQITEKAKQASAASVNRCSIRFYLSRVQMRSMHFAVDRLDLAMIFPQAKASPTGNTEPPDDIKLCLEELKRSELTSNQQNSITSMLKPECISVPSLVLGPFGCGKTRTLSECIKLLSLHVPSSQVLVCTHSNSAANLYVESMDEEWRGIFHDKAPLFRLYYTGRRLNTVPFNVRQYCSIENGSLVTPPLQELKSYKVVVSTLQTARSLALMGLNKGHFTHIFIDEAAQALEAETLVPLCLANETTKVILAGDHMQMDPPCYSPIARKYNLHISLLERLYDLDTYNSGVGQLCKTLLTENHRSHQQILELPSKLFYKNQLSCSAKFPNTGPKDIPPLMFIGVDGQEMQEEDSPSFFNDHETIKISEQVQELVSKGLEMQEVCVLAYYSKQVQRIRNALRGHRLSQVTVCRVDDIQGREYRALLLSTVRTCSEEPGEEEGGFLTNPKLFNTAVTRAREWLIVVGEPITLCTVGSNRLCWLEFIRKCNQLGSFGYPNAQHFESFLETRLIARQILEKQNEGFLKKIKSAHPEKLPSSVPPHPVPAPHPAQQPLTVPTPSHPFVINYTQAGQQRQRQVLRAKVTEAAHRADEATVSRITDELLKMSVDQQGMLLARPDYFQARVRDMEQVLRRAGPTAAVMNAARLQTPLLGSQTAHFPSALPPQPGGPYPGGMHPFSTASGPLGPIGAPQAPVQSDLPPFIARMIEALTAHLNWCDFVLQNNPNLTTSARDNLLKQKANIGQQLKLVNDQVNLYRELQKIVKSSQQPVPATAVAMATRGGPSHPAAVPPKMAPGGPALAHPAEVGVSLAPPTVPHIPPSMPSTTHGPGGVAIGGAPVGVAPPKMAQQPASVNSAFTYGVSAYLQTDQRTAHLPPQQPQLTVQTKRAPGRKPIGRGSGGGSRSPLEAAINARSSPLPPAQIQDDELYVSDDEFN